MRRALARGDEELFGNSHHYLEVAQRVAARLIVDDAQYPLATVETPHVQADPASSYVTVVTPTDEPTIDEAVKQCLNSLDLFGEKTDAILDEKT
ncbi:MULTISPECIES: hypothetical protein [unclassified Caballeronia]|uniref:hypothetical protein n=1 Tax=unclassified Caballeronia TaxID=2646786 RepID=UPI002027C2DA|nr:MULTISPECIES: hypothetical protein [unclassified Caballeronia]